MVKVSVIIPVYRVEPYIDRCFRSVQAQTLKSIQIILVDDGSPDRCGDICDGYAREDSRVRVIHKENGGLSSARNAGLRIAEGEYVFFIDSDDWIDGDTLFELCNIADESHADFVRFRPMTANWPGIPDGSLCDFGTERCMHQGIYEKEQIVKEIFPSLIATPQLTLGVVVSAWRSLYRLRFLNENVLYFKDDIRYSEDTIFSANVVYVAHRFVYLDGPRYYHYYYNRQSITKSYRSDRWENYKKLMGYFDRDFSTVKDYDFRDQLWLQKLYCISSALGDCRNLIDSKTREESIKVICADPVTKCACKHLNLLQTSKKNKIYFQLVRFGLYRLLARM